MNISQTTVPVIFWIPGTVCPLSHEYPCQTTRAAMKINTDMYVLLLIFTQISIQSRYTQIAQSGKLLVLI